MRNGSFLFWFAGEIVGANIDGVIQILKNSTSSDCDPEVILKMVLTCHTILQEHDITLPAQHLVERFITSLIDGTFSLYRIKFKFVHLTPFQIAHCREVSCTFSFKSYPPFLNQQFFLLRRWVLCCKRIIVIYYFNKVVTKFT